MRSRRTAATRRIAALPVAAWLVVLALMAPPAPARPEIRLPADPLRGRRVFVSKGCGECHAIWGTGGTAGPDLGKLGMGDTLLGLAGTLWNHSPQMVEKMRERRIARQLISPEEMGDLASFLYSLNYFDEPGDPVEGRALFRSKGCERCHGIAGSGGGAGPDLGGFREMMSPVFLAAAMWNHGPGMSERMRGAGLARPRFERTQMADLLAYIRASGNGTPASRIYAVPGNAERGRELFEDRGCARCHDASDLRGPRGPDLGQKPLRTGVTEIAAALWNSGPEMWSRMRAEGVGFPEFSGREMSDLLAYLYFLRFLDSPGDPVAGERVFQDRGCAACHGLDGSGEHIGPDLLAGGVAESAMAWASAMWNHAPAMEKKEEEIGMKWPHFEGNEMRDLLACLQERAARKSTGTTDRGNPREPGVSP